MVAATDIDALADEAVAANDTVKVTLVDTELDVLPSTEWRSSAIHAVHIGDFAVWAETSLTAESWEIWQEIDPTLGEVTAFFKAYENAARESLGKSSASPRSSKRTARR